MDADEPENDFEPELWFRISEDGEKNSYWGLECSHSFQPNLQRAVRVDDSGPLPGTPDSLANWRSDF